MDGRPPHPIPYQGSKRLLAPAILEVAARSARLPVRRLYEPFAGSAALTLAAARRGLAERFVLADTLAPLVDLWRAILERPAPLADAYERLWRAGAAPGHYQRVRADYNASGDPARLLYLLTRCVKSAPRWSLAGAFNQSPDRRRRGTRPDRLRRAVAQASALLAGRTELRAGDFEATLADATPADLAYLDPPWQGVTDGRDRRYRAGLARDTLVGALERLSHRGVPWLLSYDGSSGARRYGAPLPPALAGRPIPLPAGRSSQATLHGRTDQTIESLYVGVR
jgi:DNA adenine methylase